MNKGRALLAIGGVMLLIGVYVLIGAIFPAEETNEVAVPAGQYYAWLSWDGLIGGSISADYSVEGSSTVMAYAFDSDQFEHYGSYGTADSLCEAQGSSDSLVFDIESTGSYYIVFEHGDGYDSTTQNIEVTSEVSGIALTGLIIGVAVIAIGAVLIVLGVRMKGKDVAPEGERPKEDDVVVFDETRPPESP